MKEGTVGPTSFMDILLLKINCKVILIHNIDTSDGLTNGQLGTLIDIVRASDGSVAKCIVEFKKTIYKLLSLVQDLSSF